MSTEDEHEAQPKPRKPWIWLSAVLAVVAAGLLIWALTLQSDLDSAQQDLERAQQELAGTSEELDSTRQELDATKQELQSEGDDGVRTGTVVAGATALYKEFADQLGATEEDLATTQRQLEEAERAAEQAEQDAEAAKQAAADAGNETERAQAEAEQAQAEAEAAESRAAIAADCAKAFISAFGTLLESEDASEQAPEVRQQLEEIAATCKDELAAS
jgi:chromosome segregation ATPase